MQPLRLKVLVVDDDEDVLTVTGSLLEADGHDVLRAESAREALALLDEHRNITLLFTDIVLPGSMDGFDLAETAKRRRPGLPVIYMSGYLKNKGAWEAPLLQKPWTKDDLYSAIADVCRTAPPGSGSNGGLP